MVSKRKVTKLEVFEVAQDFVNLAYQKKFAIGQHFLQLTDEDAYLPEADIEELIWKEANKNLANFSHFVELVETYSEVAS